MIALPADVTPPRRVMYHLLLKSGLDIDEVWWSAGYQTILFPHLFAELPAGVTAFALLDCVPNQQAGNKFASLDTLTLWGYSVVKFRTHMIPGFFLSTFMPTQPVGWGCTL
uniref:Uncharacterized protein n=1 Tax=Eutreptiella gymnastica TaxID=73025 RepID=A0A7S4G653_9EUGL